MWLIFKKRMVVRLAPTMKSKRYGKIINMSSVVVDTGRANYAHYVASKGAVVAFTRALATELGSYDINVSVSDGRGGVGLRNINAMTPETETTTHYFWGISQDRNPKDTDATEAIFREIQNTMKEDVEVFADEQMANDFKGNSSIMMVLELRWTSIGNPLELLRLHSPAN